MITGARTLDTLEDGDTVLISEGCTHHRQCDDIGSVKLPQWILAHTKKNSTFHLQVEPNFQMIFLIISSLFTAVDVC